MTDDPRLERALQELERDAINFAMRCARIAEVRTSYIEQIKEMSASIRSAVAAGDLSAARAADVANELRNQIMEMQRAHDFDLGRAYARNLKAQGITLEEAIAKAMAKLKLGTRPFAELSGAQQRAVFEEVIEAAGRSRPKVTASIPRFRAAGRAFWLAGLAIAVYNIGTSENPWWQSGREGAGLAGGVGGGFAGGAAIGLAGGIWAGPIGVAIGVLIGGALGALLSDRAYVEVAGASDPRTRNFVARFTSFWSGVDEAGLARALADSRGNPAFIERVIQSLDSDYHTDADDVALELVRLARRDTTLASVLRGQPPRDVLIRVLRQGWTADDEDSAIQFLRSR